MSDYTVDDLTATFGDRVRMARLARRLKQRELADRVGLTRVSISNIEADRQNPGLAVVVAIADVLRTTVGALLGEVDPPPSDRDEWPTQQQWAAFCGGSDPDESAHLELFDDPADAEEIAAWLKGGQVAARLVAYGPWVIHRQPGPELHPTNRDLNQMEGPS